MADEMTPAEEKAKKEQREKAFEEYSKPFVEKNKALGVSKGLRYFTNSTRGKGSMFINYQGFDTDKPETLPSDLKEFAQITGINEQKDLLDLLIEGYNATQYQTASDPIAEFVNDSWDKDTKAQFRLVVRNLSKAADIPLEQAVAMVKPGIEAKFAKEQQVNA